MLNKNLYLYPHIHKYTRTRTHTLPHGKELEYKSKPVLPPLLNTEFKPIRHTYTNYTYIGPMDKN